MLHRGSANAWRYIDAAHPQDRSNDAMRLNWGLGAPLPDLSSLAGDDGVQESKRAKKRAAQAARKTAAAASPVVAEAPVATAAVKEAAAAVTKELAAALKESINFATGSPALTPDGKVIVNKVAAVLIKYKSHNLPVTVTGHTDCGKGCSGDCNKRTLAGNRCNTIIQALQVRYFGCTQESSCL